MAAQEHVLQARQNLTNPTNGAGEPEPDFEEGIGLCLSGGGYRAMLFHVGTLWRLHEVGMLEKLQRISSVSGGSITAAVLALAWGKLLAQDAPGERFKELVVGPVRGLAERTIDKPAVLRGLLLPGSISDRIVASYRKALFGAATLQVFPDTPRFVINATSLQSAVLWRFSKPYMGDWQVGRVFSPAVEVATAVAASSAFPPFLSPRRIALRPGAFPADPTAPLQKSPYTSEAVLADGGVYDNLGLETVWKRYRTVLVSDAGMKITPDAKPPTDWALGSKRVMEILDNQVRSLRKRQLLGSLTATAGDQNYRRGSYWSIRGDVADYPAKSPLTCPIDRTSKLAEVPTGLSALPAELQERLINWGYVMCDVALRSYLDPELPAATAFPYAHGV